MGKTEDLPSSSAQGSWEMDRIEAGDPRLPEGGAWREGVGCPCTRCHYTCGIPCTCLCDSTSVCVAAGTPGAVAAVKRSERKAL